MNARRKTLISAIALLLALILGILPLVPTAQSAGGWGYEFGSGGNIGMASDPTAGSASG